MRGNPAPSAEQSRMLRNTNSWWPRRDKTATSARPSLLAHDAALQHLIHLETCRRSQKAQVLRVYLTELWGILSRFPETSRNSEEDDAHGRTSDARAWILGKVTTMANVASAPPGKLRESVHAKAASAKAVAAPKPALPPAPVASARPATAAMPVAPIKAPSQTKPALLRAAAAPAATVAKPAVAKPAVAKPAVAKPAAAKPPRQNRPCQDRLSPNQPRPAGTNAHRRSPFWEIWPKRYRRAPLVFRAFRTL